MTADDKTKSTQAERLVQLRDAAEAREDIALEAAFRELLGDGGAGTP